MRKTLVFLFVALLLLVGCATKENEKEESSETLPSSTVAESEFGYYGPIKGGMVPPEGMIAPDGAIREKAMYGMMAGGDRNMGSGGYLSLTEDVSFTSTLDYSEYIGEPSFTIDESQYLDYPILIGEDGLVGTTRMLTSLVVEVDGSDLKITNTSNEKYNVILSGSWNGGITVESRESDIMVTLASSISGMDTPALILKGGNTTYIKSEGNSVLCDSSDNNKKGVVTSDGNLVFFGNGEITINGEKKHGLKVDGKVTVESGTVRINTSETAEGNGISADEAFIMNGGYLYIKAMGSVYGEEGKGIKVNGKEGDDPLCTVEINGGYIEIESVGKGITSGFEAEEDGETEDTSDDPDPILVINGGVVKIHTTGTPYEISEEESLSPEGLEAKDKLVINGGIVEVSATDDAINAGNSVEINGGYVFALSRGDDGLDSNGTITISGGRSVIMGAGGMGLGIDCDNDGNIKYLGGFLIGIGGGNNAPQSGDNLSFSFDISGDSFVLQDENGKVIAAYTLSSERNMNNVVVMSKELEKGKTYSVISGASIESEGNFNGLGLGSVTYKDGVVSYSSIAQSVASGSHYSMGGGMKGGAISFEMEGGRTERPNWNN